MHDNARLEGMRRVFGFPDFIPTVEAEYPRFFEVGPGRQAGSDQEGPGRVGVELSLTKSRLRDLDSDKAISREERDLLRLYYTREQEKLQLKLRVFGEAEKIKALESAIRPNHGVQKSESQHSLGEALVNAHSELQRISTALEQLCRDDAKWEKQETLARKWRQSRTWQAITPEEVQPAVEAIRYKIEHYGFWQSKQSTVKLCFAALHPAQTTDSDAESLSSYKQFLVTLLNRRFENLLLASDRPGPVIFKSHLDVLEAAMKVTIRAGFQEMFEIAKARNDVLAMHPVEWTKRQLDILISAEKSGIRVWIKQVCDPLDYSIGASCDDSIFLGNWRAPRLIHMRPAGNTHYDHASAWEREDLIRSEELVEARAEHTTDFLRLALDELVRVAHVEFVKTSAAKRQVSRPGEGTGHAAPTVRSVGGSITPDVWRSLHDRFKALADEEVTLAPQNSGDRWLRAYVDYKDRTNTCGHWDLSSSIHENFRERFEVEATRAGIALGPDLTGEPLTLWLHHVFSDLRKHESKWLFAATEEGGVIVRVCEASALYCARLEKQALIEGRKGPSETNIQSQVVGSELTNGRMAEQDSTQHDPRKETIREAVIRKVQNPQTYTWISTPEACAYFEVKPRTIHRWIASGHLRSGPRRGSITIESVLRLEKQRSRKRQNR
jgi:hypothetical protein